MIVCMNSVQNTRLLNTQKLPAAPCHTHREALLQHSMKHHLFYSARDEWVYIRAASKALKLQLKGNYSEAKVQNVSHKVYLQL